MMGLYCLLAHAKGDDLCVVGEVGQHSSYEKRDA